MDFDRLPSSVLDDILARLPLQEAVRTSRLSRRWRHRWESIPRLTFDAAGLPPRPTEVMHDYESRLAGAVGRVLLRHAGPIHEFRLSTLFFSTCPDVGEWVRRLSRKGVRRVALGVIWSRGQRELPAASLLQCDLLNHLELFNWVFSLPAAFKGFRDLVTLDLQRITFSGDDLERLISNCPVLEELHLQENAGCNEISVCAPKLRRLRLAGSFRYLFLKNTPVLATASIELSPAVPPGDILHEITGSCYLMELFSALPCIESLEIKAHFLEALSVGTIPERLPAIAKQLRNVTVDVNLEDLKECKAALCLFRSCPNLEKLAVHHRPSESPGADIIKDFWEAKEGLDCKLDELTSMEMSDVVGVGAETAFMGFILANAPKLVLLNVRLDKTVLRDISKFKEVTRSLLSCTRASKRAKIILLE